MNEKPRCGCGRSVTGFCMGWHALSEEDYQKKKRGLRTQAAEQRALKQPGRSPI